MKLVNGVTSALVLGAMLASPALSQTAGERPSGAEGGKEGGKGGGKAGGKSGGKTGGKSGGKTSSRGPPAGGRPGGDFAPDRAVKRGKVAAEFGKKGGAIRLCFDEDTCEHAVHMVLDHLSEVTGTGNETTLVQRAEKFRNAEFSMTEPVTEVDEFGASRLRVNYAANLSIGSNASDYSQTALFEMESFIYFNESTAANGNQTIDIPKDSLKFSFNITNWPWLDDNTENSLELGMRLVTRSRGGYKGTQKPEKKRGRGRDGKVARIELGDSEFIDAPELCVTDGVENTVQSSTTPLDDDGIILKWAFPHFTNYVYYDPLVGDSGEVVATAEPTMEPTPVAVPSSSSDAAVTRTSAGIFATVMTIGLTMLFA